MSLGELGTNCYIIYDDVNALIVDPGGEPEKVIDFLDENKLLPQAILLTHAHFDHIGGVDMLRKHFKLDVYLHEAEENWLGDPSLNRSTSFMRREVITSAPEHLLKPGRMQLASFSFEVIHTPGHSPGSVSFIFPEAHFVVSGDVLFEQGIGRTDLPGGDMHQLVTSIKVGLYQLPDNYLVYPGHGGKTTIGAERKLNPYVPG